MIKKLPYHCIKYTGTKRSLSPFILSHIPFNSRIIEPFCGSASMTLTAVYNNLDIKNPIISDINSDIISLLHSIKYSHHLLSLRYRDMHGELNKRESIDSKKEYYENIRLSFNKRKDISEFLFLMRTCYNGLIRYNKKGEFNSPLHLRRNGINPDSLEKQLEFISCLLKNVEIRNDDYMSFKDDNESFFLLDPPYEKTKGMYIQSGFDLSEFKNFLSGKKFVLTFDDGSDFFDFEYIDLPSFKSAFNKLKQKENNVSERLFFRL